MSTQPSDITDRPHVAPDSVTLPDSYELLRVLQRVRNGDFSARLPGHWDGVAGKIADAFNDIVNNNELLAGELERVGEMVGKHGKTRRRVRFDHRNGAWAAMGSSVNELIEDLLRPMTEVTSSVAAVAKGDLSQTVPLEVEGRALEGEFLRSAKIVNRMIDQMNVFTSEVTRVAREVGAEGKLGGQAMVNNVSGVWHDLTENVNSMADNLTAQVRNISEVTIAVASGDLSRKITVDSRGEILQLKEAINTMVDQLRSFASEVTRVAREVGTEGKLGGQAIVPGVAGTWKDLTDNVNVMATNLTDQVRGIAEVTTAVARGDLSRKITVDVKGEILEVKNTINTMVDQLNSFASEVTRVAREVGTEGKLGGHAQVPGVAGTWKDLTDNVNSMGGNLTAQVRNIAEVATAIARGDLSRKITVDVKGEILELKNTINTMVDQLNSFAAEVTRVAREVGTEGKLGGQATVPGVAGTWKDLTDNVNDMAENLTSQVRGIVKVVTAVANGDLAQKLTVESKGEVAALADTINSMTDTLATFADQVTTVAREVGVEGRLGGQANVPGAAGTWKDLTANVNLLAANLTTQVRAIADVATAVTKGDLTRYIQVDARGEVADLKNYINSMIGNLRETTERNTEEDWLKTNLAKFGRMMQGQRDLRTVAEMLLSELAPLVEARHAIMYVMTETEKGLRLRQLAAYADSKKREEPREYELGESLIGQCAQERRTVLLTEIPSDSIRVSTGLLDLAPRSAIVLPVLFERQVKAVIELASLEEFTASHRAFLEQLTDTIGVVLNNIEVTMRTERLLAQSQQLAAEQQSQQLELKQTNEELAQKAQLLAAQNVEVERKNKEIEQARRALEEKAAELALTSRYKSEFLANMSHELRTPLNSILVLGQQLADNTDTNLTPRQVEYAKTIHDAGRDLLNLISDILDLSKIESGTVSVECEDLEFATLNDSIERSFRHEAEIRELEFTATLSPTLPASINTDPKRLRQVLKNLLSNALKFTEKGSVELQVFETKSGWTKGHPVLDYAPSVVAFAVKDTGMGIPADQQRIVFEAFQQGDAGTARKHSGTGLGLAISRELAHLLGGEITVESETGRGSIFTLFLPAAYMGAAVPDSEKEASGAVETGQAQFLLKADVQAITDDRAEIGPDDDVILIIEGDPHYAEVVLDLARARGFKGVVGLRGADALKLARKHRPLGISLAMSLPDMVGWAVLRQLKQDHSTRHIPVQVLADEEERHHALSCGAISLLGKPIDTDKLGEGLDALRDFARSSKRRLLVVEDESNDPYQIASLLDNRHVETFVARSAQEGLRLLGTQDFECVVVQMHLPDMSGLDLLGAVQHDAQAANVPFILYDPSALPDYQRRLLQAISANLILREAGSPERLLDECAMFLHLPVADLPERQQGLLRSLYDSDKMLAGKRVLVVDDDERNIFALSTVLERHSLEVISANTGADAIRLIDETPDISLVLLDIMMPEMDGYETMHKIRAKPIFQRIPIIALTAKAMKGDREKCLAAGASDYLAKPVDVDRLLLALRVWLHR